MNFRITFNWKQDELFDQITTCEGRHFQQVVYSTYGKTLTQVCFDCERVRTTKVNKGGIDRVLARFLL